MTASVQPNGLGAAKLSEELRFPFDCKVLEETTRLAASHKNLIRARCTARRGLGDLCSKRAGGKGKVKRGRFAGIAK